MGAVAATCALLTRASLLLPLRIYKRHPLSCSIFTSKSNEHTKSRTVSMSQKHRTSPRCLIVFMTYLYSLSEPPSAQLCIRAETFTWKRMGSFRDKTH